MKGGNMSTWTHINGNIRLDFLGMTSLPNDKDEWESFLGEKKRLETLLGPQTPSNRDIDDSNVSYQIPEGSEGTIRYEIIPEVNTRNGVRKVRFINIILTGDLRDYGTENVKELFYWWQETLEKLERVRQAVILVEPEDGQPATFHKYMLEENN